MLAKIPKVNLDYYVDPKTVAAIYGGLGIDVPASSSIRTGINIGGHKDEDVGEEVEEEVDEDIRDSFA